MCVVKSPAYKRCVNSLKDDDGFSSCFFRPLLLARSALHKTQCNQLPNRRVMGRYAR